MYPGLAVDAARKVIETGICDMKIQRNVFETSFYIERKRNKSKFTAADPLKIIYINPNKIKYESGTNHRSILGRVYFGEEDMQGNMFNRNTRYKAMRSVFINGKSWKDTEMYKKDIEKIKKNSHPKFDSESDWQEYTEALEDLYNNIKQSGLKSQRELYNSKKTFIDTKNDYKCFKIHDEIPVDICKDGEMVRSSGGTHRLSIAKILNIQSVPVVVKERHNQWERIVRKMLKSKDHTQSDKYGTDVLEHPDVDTNEY